MADEEWTDEEGNPLPELAEETDRDIWIELLMEAEGHEGGNWSHALIVQYNDDMVMRIRTPDGTEKIYDVVVRREMELVPTSSGESN